MKRFKIISYPLIALLVFVHLGGAMNPAFWSATAVRHVPSGGGGGGDITTGLVGLWTLDDNAANTTVVDSSANTFTGTASATTSTLHSTGQVGTGAFLLNGSSQYVNLPEGPMDALSGGTECTFACWFKGTLIQSAMRFQTQNGSYIILGLGTTSPLAVISTDGGTSGVAIAGVQDGAWHHVAMTWKKNTVNGFKVYVDKALSAQRDSANVNLPIVDNVFPPILGRYGGDAEYMNGTIDDARVYSRALTATDISTLP